MKRTNSPIRKTAILIFIILLNKIAFSQFTGGSGILIDPYWITSAADLNQVRNYPSAHFLLLNDIDLSTYLSDGQPGYNSGSFWQPIGNTTTKFTGVFNGNNHKIYNLKINRPAEDYVGLFGIIENASFLNLTIEIQAGEKVKGATNTGILAGKTITSDFLNITVSGNVHISASKYNVALLSGEDEDSDFLSCNAAGILTSDADVLTAGGLIGLVYKTRISHCTVNASITAKDNVGGIGGDVYDAQIQACYTKGTINANDFAGGIAGTVSKYGSSPLISDCYSISEINGNSKVGGLFGYTYFSLISYCYSTGKVTGVTVTGGLIGLNDQSTSIIAGCFWDSETSGQTTSDGGTKKTSLEMKQQNLYMAAGWDFMYETTNGTKDFWNIHECYNNGYPYLTYQVFSPSNSVVYHGNNSTSGTVPNGGSCHPEGSQIVIASQGDLLRTGYQFMGWNTASDGSGVNYSPGSNATMPAGTFNLYAYWLAVPAAPSSLTATNVSTTTITVQWNVTDMAAKYYLDIATDINFTNLLDGAPFTINIPTVTYEITGLSANTNYYFRVRANNVLGTGPNSETLAVKTLEYPTGITTYNQKNFRVYPNPSDGNVLISSDNQIQTIEITDIAGKKIFSQNAQNDILNIKISMQGTYFITVKTKTSTSTQKIIVK